MRRYAARTFRPLIYTSVALLILSFVAPWMWRAVGLTPTPVAESNSQPEKPPLSKSVLLVPQEAEDPETKSAGQLASIPKKSWEPEAAEIANPRESKLQEFEVQPILGDVMPPVAERIEF